MRCTFQFGLLLLCLGASVQPVAARHTGLRPKSEKFLVKSRIVARVPLETYTSVGLNYQSYIFEFDSGGKQSAPQLVKVSYRFQLRDPQLPSSFHDYSLVHRFRVTRDDSCDETWGSLTTRYLFDRGGNFRGSQSALVYSRNVPVPPHMDNQAILPCYVVTPRDYESTTKQPLPSQLALNQPSPNPPAQKPPRSKKLAGTQSAGSNDKPSPDASSPGSIAAAK